jgi:hypothetical protein
VVQPVTFAPEGTHSSDDNDLGLTNGECKLTLYANQLRTVEPFAVGPACTITMRNAGRFKVADNPLFSFTAEDIKAFEEVATVIYTQILFHG